MNDSSRRILGILLAAGSGSRFGGPTHKLLATLRGEAVVSRSLRAMRSARLDGWLLVTGAVPIPADVLSQFPGVVTCHNTEWASGQRSSVICGLRYARDHGFDSVIVGLADQPFIPSSAWDTVSETDSPIVVATYNGHRGNPVKLESAVWDLFETLTSDADEGARTMIRLHPELVLEVACKGTSADIDSPEDLEKWT